jgi:hypothetical protein
MKNNTLILLLTILFPCIADATIRLNSQKVGLLTTSMPQEFIPPSHRKKLPLPKTPEGVSSELHRQFLRGQFNVRKLLDHKLFQLDEQALEGQVRNLDAQFYADPTNTELDQQLENTLRNLKRARDLRQNLNGAWDKVKKEVRNKKRPRHQRDIQGSLFESPLKKGVPIEKVNPTKHHRNSANFIG